MRIKVFLWLYTGLQRLQKCKTTKKVSEYLSMCLAAPSTSLLSLSHSTFVTWPKQELSALQLFFERKQVYPLLLFNIAANSISLSLLHIRQTGEECVTTRPSKL